MAEFDNAIGTVLKNEGGYVCDPKDPGGETNYGICKRDHPEVDIKALTREEAIEIYRRRYWQPLFDQIHDQALATELLDTSVNQGPGPAVLALQRAINDLGGHVTLDGVFGSSTLQLVNRLDPTELLIDFKAEQILRYMDLATTKPDFKRFLKGWIIRAVASLALVLLLAAPAQAAPVIVDWTVEENGLVMVQFDTDGDGMADREELHIVARSVRTAMTDAELTAQAEQDGCWLFIVEEDDGRFVYFVLPAPLEICAGGCADEVL